MARFVDRQRELQEMDKAPRVAPGKEWQIHYVLFARAGFTDAARTEAEAVGAQLIDLEKLDTDLRMAMTEA